MSASAAVGFAQPEFGTRFVYPSVPRPVRARQRKLEITNKNIESWVKSLV